MYHSVTSAAVATTTQSEPVASPCLVQYDPVILLITSDLADTSTNFSPVVWWLGPDLVHNVSDCAPLPLCV